MTLIVDPDVLDINKLGFYSKNSFVPLYETKDSYGVASYRELPNIPNKHKRISTHYYPEKDIQNYLGSLFSLDKRTYLLTLFMHAQNQGASDVHFFRNEYTCSIYFRLLGELVHHETLPMPYAEWIFSQIKLRGHCDVSITNKPQDGRLVIGDIQMRISTLPSAFGDDIVCRLINKNQCFQTINTCGFPLKKENAIKRMLQQTSGLILVTGPTGSGKTTTLYAMLAWLKEKTKGSIVSLEDPIEKILPGIRQSPINTASNYTFNTALRATLRQDPDIIFVGEIRDSETAITALNAAYTGHLVLSSLHTDCINSTLHRLQGLDLDPLLLSYSLRGIISQRLVKQGNIMTLESETLEINLHGKTLLDTTALIDHGTYFSFLDND
jgi:type II secretory ATPase GspE/PulE/Tfp pilus assembly ATPase PilB-like protein